MTTPEGTPSDPASAALDDGEYDVFVVDADLDEPAAGDEGPDHLHLSLTVVGGSRKGEVVELTATGLDRDAIDLIGMPGTLTVTAGVPRLRIDDA